MAKLSNLRRINLVMEFYRKRGVNKESVNFVYRCVIKQKNIK